MLLERRGCAVSDMDNTALLFGLARRYDAMGVEPGLYCRPAVVESGPVQGMLNPAKEMVGQYGQKDMPLDPISFLVKIRTQAQLAFQGPEGIFH